MIHNLGKYIMIFIRMNCKMDCDATNHENLHLDDYVIRIKYD